MSKVHHALTDCLCSVKSPYKQKVQHVQDTAQDGKHRVRFPYGTSGPFLVTIDFVTIKTNKVLLLILLLYCDDFVQFNISHFTENPIQPHTSCILMLMWFLLSFSIRAFLSG